MRTNKLVGKRLKKIRETLGYTQEDMALMLGLSRPHISNMESGKWSYTLERIEEICGVFNMEPHHFMKGIWWKSAGNTDKKASLAAAPGGNND